MKKKLSNDPIVPSYKKPNYKNVVSKYKNPPIKKTLKKHEPSCFDKMHIQILESILEFASNSIKTLINLQLVCRKFFYLINKSEKIWNSLLNQYPLKIQKEIIQMQKENNLKKAFIEYKSSCDLKKFKEFEKNCLKLCDYNASRFNLPNKLIKKLELTFSCEINKKIYKNVKFIMKSQNFSSNIFAKIAEISNFSLKECQKFMIKINVFSKYLEKKIQIDKKFEVERIISNKISKKVYNFYYNENFLFAFFENDEKLLYFIFEISCVEIFNLFQKEFSQKNEKNNKKSVVSLSFFEQIKYTLDFEFILKIHNGKDTLYDFINTKMFPYEYDMKKARFRFKIDEKINNFREFYLDNELGMAEKIENLFLVDMVLKDHDRFIAYYSGFSFLDESKEINDFENNFEFIDAKILKLSIKKENFSFEFFIVESEKNIVVSHFTLQIENK